MNGVLTIGGSDCSCDAGIQADLTTFHETQCKGATVITCITAQNSQRVSDVYPVPSHIIAAQLDAIFEALPIGAVKIGMLYSREIIHVVAEKLRSLKATYIVLDPVMISTSGCALLNDEAVETLRRELFPLATLITPNLHEVERLVNHTCVDFMAEGESLLKQGPQAVLIKGGHHPKQKGWDCLFRRDEKPYWLKQSTIQINNQRGTGCRLSAAIAAFLAKGLPLQDAVFHGKSYVHRYLIADHRRGCDRP